MWTPKGLNTTPTRHRKTQLQGEENINSYQQREQQQQKQHAQHMTTQQNRNSITNRKDNYISNQVQTQKIQLPSTTTSDKNGFTPSYPGPPSYAGGISGSGRLVRHPWSTLCFGCAWYCHHVCVCVRVHMCLLSAVVLVLVCCRVWHVLWFSLVFGLHVCVCVCVCAFCHVCCGSVLCDVLCYVCYVCQSLLSAPCRATGGIRHAWDPYVGPLAAGTESLLVFGIVVVWLSVSLRVVCVIVCSLCCLSLDWYWLMPISDHSSKSH